MDDQRPGQDGSPARAAGVQLLGELSGAGYRFPPLLVQRGDGQIVQLTRLLYRVLAAVDGQRDDQAIAAVVSAETTRLVTAEDVRYLLEHKLRPLGLLRNADGSEPALPRVNPLLGLRCRLVVAKPAVTARLAGAFAWLFRPAALVPLLAAFALACWWALLKQDVGAAIDEAFREPSMLLLLVGLTVTAAAFHELGHAAACRYGGAAPGAMGAALYLVWPVFYTDVTDSYRLDRRGRLRVDLGGLYFNAIFTVATVAAAAATGSRPLLLMVPVQMLQMARQLVPLVRFDGYHILADLTGVPDLFSRIRPVLRSVLPSAHPAPAAQALKPWVRVVVAGWVALVVPVLAGGLAFVAWTLPRAVRAAAQSLPGQRLALLDSLDEGALARAVLVALSIATAVIVPASMAYLLARVARQAGSRLWVATAGHPAQRAVAGFAALALLAGLAPGLLDGRGGEQVAQSASRPEAIAGGGRDGSGPDEPPPGRTSPAPPAVPVLDVEPVAHEERVAPQPAVARRSTLVTRSVAPADATPAPQAPAPRAGAGAGAGADGQRTAWPFPFDSPAPPGPGDNHAVAVNTRDGRSEHAVALALQWLDGGAVLNANRAYALAECVDCTTVAVAFQALIVQGAATPVAPQNVAVALNHACQACVTDAVAVQLVATLTRPVDEPVKAEITRRFAQLQGLRGQIRQLTPAQVRDRVLGTRAAMLALLEPYTQPLPTIGEAVAGFEGDAPGEAAPAPADPDASTDGDDATRAEDALVPDDESANTEYPVEPAAPAVAEGPEHPSADAGAEPAGAPGEALAEAQLSAPASEEGSPPPGGAAAPGGASAPAATEERTETLADHETMPSEPTGA